ncbi:MULTISPECIES: hypothetical protein [Cupriavidus]|jgi:hypothetical protein|uniref:DUF4148 domain-containing protein n=1 Tax=Cupriavidus pauculus TaxID=82633 RepID=A0A5P2HE16_9BURK|nr:hypothetical protein [Cupriavidus pauculus]QET06461.1 hypothetical protein FOB72_31755 [Cupriavidus pauculus]
MKRLALSTLAATLLFSAFAVTAQASTPVDAAQNTSRAYIDADLDAYVKSGLSALNRGDGSPFVFGTEYQRRQALYRELRAENFARLQQQQ